MRKQELEYRRKRDHILCPLAIAMRLFVIICTQFEQPSSDLFLRRCIHLSAIGLQHETAKSSNQTLVKADNA